jgi:hypothetical protein
MYYNNLGNLGYYDVNGHEYQPGWGLQNAGPFKNLQADYGSLYWSGTELPHPYMSAAVDFWFYSGVQWSDEKDTSYYDRCAWAVRDGDVAAAVPIPGAVWLLGSGLAGMGLLSRRKRRLRG